jgi:predicted nucleic acid-binding protein
MATSLLLPDSNFYINCARRQSDPFIELAAHVDEWEFATCGIVVTEVCRGRSNPHVLRKFRERFALMIFLQSTSAIWERTAQLAWTLDRSGAVIPAPDLLIAATALERDATVLTSDGHFQHIPGLRVLQRLS